MKDGFERYLIEAVKKRSVLYDRNAVGYNNKENVEAAWSEVYQEVSKNVKNVNIIHCKLRWRTLRDRFVKQITKTSDGSEHFTAGANKWEYTSQMIFLTQHLKKRKCEDTCIPMTIKREIDTKHAIKRRSSDSNPTDCTPQLFSFVETNSVHILDTHPDSSRSHFLSESETQDSDFEREIDMPHSTVKRSKFEDSEYPLDCLEIEEPEMLTIERSNLKVNINEASLNKLLNTTNELLQQQIKQNARKSPNESYFKVLDGYFAKLPPNELDKVKVEILNLILTKKKSAIKRN